MRFAVLAVFAAVTVSLAAGARADEIFVCPDRSLVYVTHANRTQQYDHPCIVAWFEPGSEQGAAKAPGGPAGQAAGPADGPGKTEARSAPAPQAIRGGRKG